MESGSLRSSRGDSISSLSQYQLESRFTFGIIEGGIFWGGMAGRGAPGRSGYKYRQVAEYVSFGASVPERILVPRGAPTGRRGPGARFCFLAFARAII